MLKITQPIPCSECGKDMDNYSMNTEKREITFRCKCGHATIVKFTQYQEILRNKYQIK